MGLLGKSYREYKADKMREQEGKKEEITVTIDDAIASREQAPTDDGVDAVARKLDFLDLASL